MVWLFQKRPKAVDVVNTALDKYVTKEQLEKLTAVCDYKGMTMQQEILDSAQFMKAKYSMKKSLEMAKFMISTIDLENPNRIDRMRLRHVFTRELLKG